LAKTREEELFCTLAAAGELSLLPDKIFADILEIRGYLKEIRGLIHSQLALTDKGTEALLFLENWQEFLDEDPEDSSIEKNSGLDDLDPGDEPQRVLAAVNSIFVSYRIRNIEEEQEEKRKSNLVPIPRMS
jgi:hypothetical protein